MQIPPTLQRRLNLFAAGGRFFRFEDELFAESNWTAIMIGQGHIPDGYDPLVDTMRDAEMQRIMTALTGTFRRAADQMPSHSEYVQQHCLSKCTTN